MIQGSDNFIDGVVEADAVISNIAVKAERRKRSLNSVPRYYKDSLSETLQDRLERTLSASATQQTQVLEELALLKESARFYVKKFSDALETLENKPDCAEANQAVSIASSMMTSAFEVVRSFSKTATDIQQAGADRFDISDLHSIVNQLTRIMYETCGTRFENLARVFESRVEQEVSFIQEKATLTPDAVVQQMDATIPLFPSEPVEEQEEAVI